MDIGEGCQLTEVRSVESGGSWTEVFINRDVAAKRQDAVSSVMSGDSLLVLESFATLGGLALSQTMIAALCVAHLDSLATDRTFLSPH